ncbi:hypothetical protein CSB20_13760 [bacterium DOLZORAL124_64_63]|nr:MAG: hypothetical protein CSB20_13760 [bacterium DOLZORAL124_64_63]
MDTAPFQILAEGRKPPRPRGLNTPEGLGDRMRTAAFAEKQAIHAFRWACERFQDVPGELRAAWAALIPEEEKHYRLIVTRMAELGFALDARPVTLNLWRGLAACETGRDFCIGIARAEERGRQAGVKLAAFLADKDPATAAVFREIVADEVAHVALADRFYGWKPE